MKSNKSSKYSKVMVTFLTIINQLKIYHWQTLIHPRHKATDKLYTELSDNIDKFIEILTGRQIIQSGDVPFRILLEKDSYSIKLNNFKDSDGYTLLDAIKQYLESVELNDVIGTSTDLANLRDEMLTSVNQAGYLFSLG